MNRCDYVHLSHAAVEQEDIDNKKELNHKGTEIEVTAILERMSDRLGISVHVHIREHLQQEVLHLFLTAANGIIPFQKHG